MPMEPNAAVVTRQLDGVLLVFSRFEGMWMIDCESTPANDDGPWCEGATAVARDDVATLDEAGRRAFHARQLRKLGLAARGSGSRVLWSMISDFDAFAP
jgi:hypothetical protein